VRPETRTNEDTKLPPAQRYGTSFRIGMTTLVVFWVLALGIAGSPAAAADGRARVSPRASVQAVQLDVADGTVRLAILAAGIALLVVAVSAAFVRARRARRRRRAGSSADARPTAGHEVERLVQLLSDEAAARGRTEGADERVQETSGADVEFSELEATSGANTLKQATSAQFDAEMLKRKPAADAQILNEKAKREAVDLKEKIATVQEQTQEGQTGPERERSNAGRLLACEVRWLPAKKTSQFVAVEHRTNGAESTIAASLPFDWRGNVPPPESPAAAAALGGLIDLLLSEGWVATGRGEEWFATKFLLPRNVTRRQSR
jgi:hypothetical protein